MTLLAANAILAVAACLVLMDVVTRMDKRTCHTIRIGVILLFPGLLAEPASYFFSGWDSWANTLIYVGLIIFFLFDKRRNREMVL